MFEALGGNICTISTNLSTNGTIGERIGANGKNGNIGYHWENPTVFYNLNLQMR